MSKSAGTLLIRADAGIQMGTGHVMRCLALGQAWQDLGGRVVLTSVSLPQLLRERLEQEQFEVKLIDSEAASIDDADQTIAHAQSTNARSVVVDGYQFSEIFLGRLRAAGCRVLAVDDPGGLNSSDVVLNQNMYASVSDYPNLPTNTALLAGSRFALLRREFRQHREQSLRIRRSTDRILVSCGGSDPTNATEKILNSLSHATDRFSEVVAVVGGGSDRADQIRAVADSLPYDIRVEHNCTNMAELMSWADVAVVAAGSTCWELACMGVPIIAVITADNQIKVAEVIESNGLGWNHGWSHDLTEEELPSLLHQLHSDAEQLSRVSRTCQSAVDGNGAVRVARMLADPILNLRPANVDDSRMLWEWRNEESVRQVSFSPDPIPWEDHCRLV